MENFNKNLKFFNNRFLFSKIYKLYYRVNNLTTKQFWAGDYIEKLSSKIFLPLAADPMASNRNSGDAAANIWSIINQVNIFFTRRLWSKGSFIVIIRCTVLTRTALDFNEKYNLKVNNKRFLARDCFTFKIRFYIFRKLNARTRLNIY